MKAWEPASGSGTGTLLAEGLRREYPAPDGPLVVLEEATFRLEPGEALAIQGPSGSGKSTLLHILGGLDPPTKGRVLLGGIDPYALGEAEQAEFRNRHVGFVFQDHHLLPQLTLLENILVPAIVRPDRASNGYAERAGLLLERVGLAKRFHHRPAEVSGGERQRAAIARALVGRPSLVLADEPTGNLDRRTAHDVGQILLDLQREEGNILIVVTHSLDLSRRFERRMELDAGRLVDLKEAKEVP